jgi:selenocysteine lyase/cysteine desulfurase
MADSPRFPFDTRTLEALRAREYARLDAQGHVYLDYTGTGLYATSQLTEHQELLGSTVFGNPHSKNPTSQLGSDYAECARASVLDFFRAPPDEYTVIFTANATAALKLVGEAFPFGPESHFLLTADNHNSVNGIREFARARGARIAYVPLCGAELRVDERALRYGLSTRASAGERLFAYPAQSNLSGVQHPLEWIAEAQLQGWRVLLDAAAFAPTNRLDLNRWHPDFVSLSFYKLFGYPTGIGCLIARRDALACLKRPWFAGGAITIVSVAGDGHDLADGETGYEDGTINFLGLPAVEIGLRYLSSVGIEVVHDRVQALTGWLLERMLALRYPDGAPLLRIYGPVSSYARGGTIAFNVLGPDGRVLDFTAVEAAASRARISLRTGCFCNPGASEAALGLDHAELAALFAGGLRPDPVALARRHAQGAVRASLGIATTPSDVERFVSFLGDLV